MLACLDNMQIIFEQVDTFIHTPLTILGRSYLSLLRNRGTLNRGIAQFGYAALVVAGVVEAIAKAILGAVFLCVALIPTLRQKSLRLAVESKASAVTSLISGLHSGVNFFQNPVLTYIDPF
jgi:hypothetical protein